MATKANGEYIPGTIAPPTNYPNPTDNNVNAHSMSWAYGDAETPLEESEDL